MLAMNAAVSGTEVWPLGSEQPLRHHNSFHMPDMEPIALSITADAAPAVHAVKEDVIAGDEETMLPSVPHSKVADTPCNGGVICSSPDAASPLAPVGACSEVFETPYTREVTARGVRAVRPLLQGQLVETAHCIRVPREEYQDHMRSTVLEHYLFHARSNGDMLLALGLGSLFNHSSRPNLDYRVDDRNQVIRFYATRQIEQGEELLIHYGPPSKLWFTDATAPPPATSSDDDSDGGMSRMQL
mmetsp:Transcript_12996/g.39353  ORF Transcript_12996/g.39353 Transcript_12996/m.39353 type:complete len:243 (-) Transcript_12996:567-1295(-)